MLLTASWDSHFKLLMTHAAQDYVSWLIGDAIVDEELSTHLQSHVKADSFYGFHIGSRKYVLHLEFQTRHDSMMARRLCEYNVIACRKFKRPVYSVVIFLKKSKVSTVSPYIVHDHNGAEIHRFHFTVIKLWEIPTEMLFEKGFNGLLPLAPLTHDGQNRDVVEKMIEGLLDSNANRDLLSLTYGLASLAFEKMDDQEWLERRFGMLEEILNETWAFKQLRRRGKEEGLQEGRQEGLQEGLQAGRQEARQKELHILLSFIQARFPVLTPLAEECRKVLTSTEMVEQLVLKVVLAQSEEEAREHLQTALKP